MPLSELSASSVTEQTEALLAAADNAAQGLTPVLEWIWDRIVSPVFSQLGITGAPVSGQQTPHIWWCPTGLAAFLPLHAAGRYPADGPSPDTALNRAVSSYTPTLRTLIQLRERQAGPISAVTGPLIVAMPQTPGAADLPGAETEASDLAGRVSHSTCLSGPWRRTPPSPRRWENTSGHTSRAMASRSCSRHHTDGSNFTMNR